MVRPQLRVGFCYCKTNKWDHDAEIFLKEDLGIRKETEGRVERDAITKEL